MMVGAATTDDPRVARRSATRDRILDAAAALAARDGLTGWTLRDVAAAVGMRAPSLYTHFDGKDAIHDELFARGHAQLADHLGALDLDGLDPVEGLVAATGAFVDFCAADVPRYQLLFTHALGEWEPSPEAYEAARASYATLVAHLAAVGVTDPAAVDLYTAVVSGLVAQQLANDLGGDRWRRLVPDAVRMILTHSTGSSR